MQKCVKELWNRDPNGFIWTIMNENEANHILRKFRALKHKVKSGGFLNYSGSPSLSHLLKITELLKQEVAEHLLSSRVFQTRLESFMYGNSV